MHIDNGIALMAAAERFNMNCTFPEGLLLSLPSRKRCDSFLALLALQRADPRGPLRVELARSPSGRRTAGICALRTAGPDVDRSFPIDRWTSELVGHAVIRPTAKGSWPGAVGSMSAIAKGAK